MIAWKSKGTQLYQSLPSQCFEGLEACDPLTEVEANRPSQESQYQTWNVIKNS